MKQTCTRAEFIAILINISPHVMKAYLQHGVALPEITKSIALECFLYPDSANKDYVFIIRKYLINLYDTGMFGFDDSYFSH